MNAFDRDIFRQVGLLSGAHGEEHAERLDAIFGIMRLMIFIFVLVTVIIWDTFRNHGALMGAISAIVLRLMRAVGLY